MLPKPRPLALTDDQMGALLRAAQPLDVDLREPFLLAVAHALRGCVQPLGDGDVFRTIREVQREFWHPPDVGHSPAHSRRRMAAD